MALRGDRRSVGWRRSLTPRETEVLVALADGRTQRAAAFALGISTSSIKKHVEHVNHKLGTESLVGAYARLGWLVPPPSAEAVSVAPPGPAEP
ncbi:MAG: response regulator transcription factor [Myxococcales bacterium]